MSKYTVHFDRIVNSPPENDKNEHLIQKAESDNRKSEWIKKSQIIEGIPGRCIVIDRNKEDKTNIFIPKKLTDAWKQDIESVLYYYNDIGILCGSAGYVLKKSDGTQLRQATMVS